MNPLGHVEHFGHQSAGFFRRSGGDVVEGVHGFS